MPWRCLEAFREPAEQEEEVVVPAGGGAALGGPEGTVPVGLVGGVQTTARRRRRLSQRRQHLPRWKVRPQAEATICLTCWVVVEVVAMVAVVVE